MGGGGAAACRERQLRGMGRWGPRVGYGSAGGRRATLVSFLAAALHCQVCNKKLPSAVKGAGNPVHAALDQSSHSAGRGGSSIHFWCNRNVR